MNISAILVTTPSANTLNMIEQLNQLEGVEVFHHDTSTGKIIAIQEAESINDEVAGLKRIKKLPNITLAEMVEHYFGEDRNLYPGSDLEKIDEVCGTESAEVCIPEFLNQQPESFEINR